jgi:hypothetical protein
LFQASDCGDKQAHNMTREKRRRTGTWPVFGPHTKSPSLTQAYQLARCAARLANHIFSML